MRVIPRIRDLRAALGEPLRSRRIGFVPTMGNLHEGHLALVEACRARSDVRVVSIFVNPLQFGAGEDFETYPRTLEQDMELLAAAGVDYVFAPSESELYPEGRDAHTLVTVPFISSFLCGASRPGHFDGVATVVLKLLNIVRPHLVAFGEKDYQQLTIVSTMVRHLELPVEILPVPTVRAPDGLALSSRNRYLTASERALAPMLHATLRDLGEALRSGSRDFPELEGNAVAALADAGLRPDYVAVRRPDTLRLPSRSDRAFVVLGAAHLGKARLIDNVQVNAEH